MRRIDKKAFGQYIKEKRLEKGYTQEQLAHRLNVSNMTISLWENGKRYPDFEMLDDLARELEVSVEDIYENSKREVVGGLPINIGMIVILVIVGIVAATGLFKAAKDKDSAKNEEDTAITTEGTTMEKLDEEDVTIGGYELKLGTYVNLNSEKKPYISVNEMGIVIGTSMYEDTCTYYEYSRKENELNLKDDKNKTETIEIIDNNLLLYDGEEYTYNWKNSDIYPDDQAEKHDYQLRGIVFETNIEPLIYIDGIGICHINNLNSMENCEDIKKLHTGDTVIVIWEKADMASVEESYPMGAYPDKIKIIDEGDFDKYVGSSEDDIFVNRDRIIDSIKESFEEYELGYEIK